MATVALGGDMPNNKREEKDSFRFTVVHKETGATNNIVIEGKNVDDCMDEMMNKVIGSDLVSWKEGDPNIAYDDQKDFSEDFWVKEQFWEEYKVTSVSKENNS